ncbi:unnamed protein product [Acanthoscelides obtectus]|uniref:Uncharacterized protein n=1 Tax=Acanthoscelides obtectus TaxID=200917 RepID=A0A9P0PTR5_ACAOB|nr:unnamed protein product [Acanthoscelides obtectus]CAK1632726.1 hypothetical protein AOBTE_LOCUS7697 [Acanthoscelides obtectus]
MEHKQSLLESVSVSRVINRSYVEPVIDYTTFIKNVNQSAEASIPKYENKNNVKETMVDQ